MEFNGSRTLDIPFCHCSSQQDADAQDQQIASFNPAAAILFFFAEKSKERVRKLFDPFFTRRRHNYFLYKLYRIMI